MTCNIATVICGPAAKKGKGWREGGERIQGNQLST